jgi:cardiolipin synthase
MPALLQDTCLASEHAPMSLRKSASHSSSEALAAVVWERCDVVHDGDLFFDQLERAIDGATKSIEIEFYIFAVDQTGVRIFDALARAVARGVVVRLLVDGIGSTAFARQYREKASKVGIILRVFHEAPWDRWWPGRESVPENRSTWRKVFRRINNRNHRKVVTIDGRTAFVGSFNITKYHLASQVGSSAWRDTGVIVEGSEVRVLLQTFEDIWAGRLQRLKRKFRRNRGVFSSPLVRLNITGKQRRESYLDLLMRLVAARKRVWITNAYFVPDGSLLRVLSVVAREGVDVRILVPGFSDVVFIPWVASAFHFGLLSAGVKIFEYRGSILHAKTMLIDDWGLIGSSNLNHRSLLHDLEADIVVTDESSVNSIQNQYGHDLGRSVEVTLENWHQRPLLERLLGRVLLWFRYVM